MMRPWFKDERKDMQPWLAAALQAQRWHVQPIDDITTNGMPDLNAGNRRIELWAELKLSQRILTPDDVLRLDHPLNGLQYTWLMNRHRMGCAVCVVVVAYRVIVDRTVITPLVTFAPITEWKDLRDSPLRVWLTRRYTASVGTIDAGANISGMLTIRRRGKT